MESRDAQATVGGENANQAQTSASLRYRIAVQRRYELAQLPETDLPRHTEVAIATSNTLSNTEPKIPDSKSEVKVTGPPDVKAATVPVVPQANDGGFGHDNLYRLYVGGLKWNVSPEALKEYLEEKFGRVESVFIKEGAHSSCGFGFVTFRTKEQMDKMLASKNLYMDNRRLKVRHANHKSSSDRTQYTSQNGWRGVESVANSTLPTLPAAPALPMYDYNAHYAAAYQSALAYYSQMGMYYPTQQQQFAPNTPFDLPYAVPQPLPAIYPQDVPPMNPPTNTHVINPPVAPFVSAPFVSGPIDAASAPYNPYGPARHAKSKSNRSHQPYTKK